MKPVYFMMVMLLATSAASGQRYTKVHERATVVDTHNDVISEVILEGLHIEDDLRGKAYTDFARYKTGGLDVQVFSIWCDSTYGRGCAFSMANRQIDSLYAIAHRNAFRMAMVYTPRGLKRTVRQRKIAAMIGVEGGHMIEDNIANLDSLYRRGARYLTLTWSNSTSWATSSFDESTNHIVNAKKGLNDFGISVVRRMNELGMMVDVSHLGEQSFYDLMNIVSKPVIASHSSVYALAPNQRNLKDDQIRAIAKNGGVIQVNFYSDFLDSNFSRRRRMIGEAHKAESDSLVASGNKSVAKYLTTKYAAEYEAIKPPLSLLLDHIEYIIKLVGVDYVGLGSDFDGISSSPKDMEDVSQYPNITKGLLERGYKPKDIRKVLGGNFIRVFRANAGAK